MKYINAFHGKVDFQKYIQIPVNSINTLLKVSTKMVGIRTATVCNAEAFHYIVTIYVLLFLPQMYQLFSYY